MQRLPVVSVMVTGVERGAFDTAYLDHLRGLDAALDADVARIVGHLTRPSRSGRVAAFEAATLVTLREYVDPTAWYGAHGDALTLPGGTAAVHLGDEVEHWPYLRHWPLGEVTPGIKQLVYSRRLPHLDPVEYERRYLEHAVVTNFHHPGVWRYAQCYFEQLLTEGAAEFHALAQLSFRSDQEQRERMYLDEASVQFVADDVDRFLDRDATAGVLAHEYRIRG